MIWASNALAATFCSLGDFESPREYAIHGVQISHSGAGKSHSEDVDTPVVGCLCYKALSDGISERSPLDALM
jgi:hypothetical protein